MAITREAVAWFERYYSEKPGSGKLMIFGRPDMKWDDAPTPEAFYKDFGYEEVHTLDVSDYQGASHIHDLNTPIPKEWEGQYDSVIAGGTLQHVFDIAQAIRNLASLAKVGGWVTCSGPANNWLDHGFYQLSPTLKFDYFAANGFELGVSTCTLTEPGLRRRAPFYPGQGPTWNASRKRLAHTLSAMRLPESTIDRVPTQGLYVGKHGNGQRASMRFGVTEPIEARDGTAGLPPMARFPLARVEPHGQGFAARFHNPSHRNSLPERPFRSTAIVYEDGKHLDWIVSSPEMVGERPGSFHHGKGAVHFTSLDGTDPRENKRLYEVAFPDLTGWFD